MSNCQNCNAPLRADDIFCRYCGTRQTAQAQPQSSPQAGTPVGGRDSFVLRNAGFMDTNTLFNVAYAKETGLMKSDFPGEAEAIYEYLANLDHLESMYRFSLLQMKKEPANIDVATKWLKIAASRGHEPSASYLKTLMPEKPSNPQPQSTTVSTNAQPPTRGSVLSGEEIYNKMEFATVEIIAIANDDTVDCASGFVVSDKGFIVTNAHAILDSKGKVCAKLAVKIHDEIMAAIPVAFGNPSDGVHDSIDIALLFAPEFKVRSVADFGKSSQCRNGQKVYLIGNSLGRGTCITSGIISDATRQMPGLSYPYIMTDAAANPGNSGGPLLNENGEVIGVLVAGIEKVKGMNYVIPIDIVKKFFCYLSSETKLDESVLGELAAPDHNAVNMSFADNLFKGLHLVLDVISFILSII